MSSTKIDDGRMYRGAAPAQRQEERRSRLVDAGLELFGTTGYRSSTVEKICATAGLTKRYFYESFDSSEALLLAAYAVATDQLRDAVVRGAATADDVESKVRNSLTEFFGLIAADPRLARIAFQEILGVSPEVDHTYRQTTLTFVRTLTALTEPSIPDDVARAQLASVATGLVGAVLMIAQQWALADCADPVHEVAGNAYLIVTAVVDRLGR